MPLSKLVPRRLVRLVRRAKMSPAGKAFVKKWEEMHDYPMPLDRMIELIHNSGERAVREGVKNYPGILHGVLAHFDRDDDPLEQVEIIRLLLEICPDAAGIPVPSNDDSNLLVYPLHEACNNYVTPNEVIELLLKKSTAGLDRMAVVHMGIVEGYTPEVAGTPLHYYVCMGEGNVAIVKRLVDACPEALTMKDTTTQGFTPLHTLLHWPSTPDFEVVKFLVQYNPSLLRECDTWDQNPIHVALNNECITVDVVEFLLESSPMDVWEMRDDDGYLPMQALLWDKMEDAQAIDILRLFLRVYPNDRFFHEADAEGKMPIHHAASAGHGADFCKMLVELAPGCERVPDDSGRVPLFGARHIDTVKYLVGLYPESIYLQNARDFLAPGPFQYAVRAYSPNATPFHYAVGRLGGMYKADIVRYFLELDPSFASTAVVTLQYRDLLPLHIACTKWVVGREEILAEVVKTLFDCYPSALLLPGRGGKLPVDLAKEALAEEKGGYYAKKLYENIISFLETQHPFVADASNNDALNTPDENGMLLLHRALLEKNISLGTVKMIVNGTNHAVAVRGPNPLHLACANCAADIIHYLLGVYPSLVNSADDEGCNILHIACKGGNLEAVQYLLEQYAPMVSQTNSMNLLPVHLLCDKSGKEEIVDSNDYALCKTEYVGLVWQLLLACPAAVSSAVATLD